MNTRPATLEEATKDLDRRALYKGKLTIHLSHGFETTAFGKTIYQTQVTGLPIQKGSKVFVRRHNKLMEVRAEVQTINGREYTCWVQA